MIQYTMRETEQDETYVAELAELFVEEGYEADPIVLVGGEILDGHHRYRAAIAAGVEPLVVELGEEEYEGSSEAGYDDVEIAAAAHLRVGNYDAANNIDLMFGGIVAERAEEAAEKLG